MFWIILLLAGFWLAGMLWCLFLIAFGLVAEALFGTETRYEKARLAKLEEHRRRAMGEV